MATTTNILWTALPNGGSSGAFKVSFYVSPRLEGAGGTGLLQDYNLGNWTDTVKLLAGTPGALRVQLGPGAGPVVPLVVPPQYAADLDPALWDAIFPAANTQVAPRQFQDHSKRWLRSFSVRPLERFIQGLYNTIADSSPHSFPDLKGTTPVTRLTDAMGRAMELMRKGFPPPREPGRPKQVQPVPLRGRATHPDAGLESDLTALAASLGVSDIPLAELYRAYRFYRRGNHLPYMSKPATWTPALVSDRPDPPKFDFHKGMAALGDHPYLLRKLGLIIDCVLPVPASALPNFNQLQAVPPPRPPVGDIRPWTQFMLSAAAGFRPEPRKAGDLREGMLRLDNAEVFDVIQTDPDGNVIKVFDYAVNMNKVRADVLAMAAKNPQAKSSDKPEETSLPALRSGGLTVTRLGRDNKLWDHLAVQKLHESAPGNAVLFADDVLRGYRVDVKFKGKWHSLCRRRGEYEVAGKVIPQPGPDEGYVKSDSGSSDPEPALGPQQPDLYIHEALVAWRNWSLVARQPGQTIVPHHQPDKKQKDLPAPADNTPGAGFAVANNFKAEALSLPPLRYGADYQLRARAVDLAGNSFQPPPSPKDPSTDEAPGGIGESTKVRYLRFDPVPAPALVLTDRVREGESVQTMVIRNRSVHMPAAFPPSLMIDETALFNATNNRWVVAPKTSAGEAEAHGTFDTLFKTPDVAFDILKRESGALDTFIPGSTKLLDVTGAEVAYPPVPEYLQGTPLPDGMYIVHTEDPVQLPYLPDPLSHGVAFMPLDSQGEPTGEVLHRDFGGVSWPDAPPFRLVLGEAAGATPVFGLDGAPASIQLPRGTMLRLRFASAIVPPDAASPGELALMGRWHGMTAVGRAQTATNGYQHWMITPWRSLTLVHAVEKPMAEPKLLKLAVPRAAGDTFVHLTNGFVTLHSPSTGEIELRGRWDEFIDDPLDETGPQVLPKDGHALDRKVDYDEDPVLIPLQRQPPPKHEFGDTKHRNVFYRAVGTTRYREYFPPALTGYEDPITKQKLITVDGPELKTNVLSSARPQNPDIEYVVPTFKWVDTAGGRVRRGRGLRIYLKRGWFSSGEGELLGVVLMPGGLTTAATAEALRDYVSLWGSDPIFDKNGPSVALDPGHFTSDPDFPEGAPVLPAGQNIKLAEKDLRVRVLGFKPQYDGARQLWFVDVELLPTNAYYTFVRFALCRYQPDSLTDLEISKVVRAEFAQLLADRSATLTFGASAIAVTLSGPSALSKLGKDWNAVGGGSGTGSTGVGGTSSALQAAAAPAPAPTLGGVLAPGGSLPPIVTDPPVVILPTRLVSNPAAGSAHLVTAQIEWRPQGSTGDLGWQPLDSAVRLASFTPLFGGDTVTWQGIVRWPRPGTPTNREYRLALREFEIYQTDSDVAESIAIPDPTGVPIRGRLVYIDVFPLTAT